MLVHHNSKGRSTLIILVKKPITGRVSGVQASSCLGSISKKWFLFIFFRVLNIDL